MTCQICSGDDATVITIRAQNALPKGVSICPLCRDAVKRGDLGIIRRPDGTLHVSGTDGLGQAHPPA